MDKVIYYDYHETVSEWIKCCSNTMENHKPEDCEECTAAFHRAIKKVYLYRLNLLLRDIAEEIGPLHSYWDIISDLENFLQNKPCRINFTLDEWILHLRKELNK